jgi:hypothetical protein
LGNGPGQRKLCCYRGRCDSARGKARWNKERPFWFIENNFLAGRTFASWEDLNQRAREWCDKVNATYKKYIRAVPRELFAVERMHLKPLPRGFPKCTACMRARWMWKATSR